MNKEVLISFYEDINKFKIKQQKQKQRGLNDYNLLTTVLSEHDEVRLHSRVIGSMLDINGLHYQGSLFLEKFIEVLKVNNFEFDISNSNLFLEYHNIDIYLTDGRKHIIVENKIYADDQKNQIKRYINTIKKENNYLKYSDVLVVYLSINRQNPSEFSLDNLVINNNHIYEKKEKITIFKNINYNNEIINWLNSCIYEVQNITNLNESILQYLTVVEKITHKHKEKVMSLKEFLLEDNNLEIALELKKPINDAKAEIQYKFWISLEKSLKENGYVFDFVNGHFKEIDLKKYVSNYYHNSKNNKYYGLKKDLLKINDKYTLSFYIEVDWNIYYGFTISENGVRKEISHKKEFEDISKKILGNSEFKWNGTNENNQKWWICWKYLNKKIDFNSFNTKRVFELNDSYKRDRIIDDIASEIDYMIKTIKV